MSLASPIRTRIEKLLTGETGSGRTMATGRFRRRSPDLDLVAEAASQIATDNAERAFEVDVGMPAEMDPVNPLDNFALYELAVTIRVAYGFTNAGGDMAEGNTSQTGAGTLDAIRDRAGTDVHDILSVLTWYANLDGLDPVLYDLHPTPGEKPAVVASPSLAVLSIPYRARIRATLPGAYAP